MKNTAFILICILSPLMVLSQPCLPDGITFTTQAQIDSFQINYPNCTEIEGSVLIQEGDITNLNGLSVLNSIGGDLEVRYQIYLVDLTGLEGLSSVGGNLHIENTAALASISELESLTSIGGGIHIVNNNALANLEGLEGLGSIGGDLGIQSNDALTSLSGLENVTSIGGDLMIRFNDELINLVDLGGITAVEGALVIESNDVLTSLTGLEGITSIGGDLYIYNNPALVNLTGLEGVKSIGEDLIIESNDALASIMELEAVNSIEAYLNVRFNNSLTSLKGLDNIDASSIMHLYIDDNPLLSNCEVQSICDYLTSPNGETSISGNAPGCFTIEEVDSICNYLIIQDQIIDDFCTVSPNPFANSTTLSFRLCKPENIQFTVYNLQSQIVYSIEEKQDKGEQKVVWNAEGLPAGLYFYRLQAGDRVASGKLVVRTRD